ncbi:hypothetical protein NFI96_012645 [Prochilodus magdalenae]|nr:hypothetical protein NFI96_012645 [Prochilodus magdalenae]
MDGSEDECVRFLQYVEDSGLRAYDELVIQNASDIARESDRIRNHTHWAYLQEQSQKKRRQDEAIKRMGEDVASVADGGAYAGKHFRMGFMTMPAPQDRLPPPSGPGFTVRSQSLHSVGGGEEDGAGSPTLRKQPPPKPKRDPNTKLSTSSETVNTTLTTGKGGKESDKSDGECKYSEILCCDHLNQCVCMFDVCRQQSLYDLYIVQRKHVAVSSTLPMLDLVSVTPAAEFHKDHWIWKRSVGVPEPILVLTGQKAGNILDRPLKIRHTRLGASLTSSPDRMSLGRNREHSVDTASKSRPCSEEYRRMPPPKPKRNPNTQLSTSFDESYIRNHGTKFKSASLPRRQKKKSASQNQSPALDTDEEAEPVYIEMVGNILRDFSHITGGNADEEDDQGESVYEEMKYPTYEEVPLPPEQARADTRWDPCPAPAVPDVELTRPTTPRGSICDIPAPFPNLLTHRPPLLVFPPAPAQCSPNSDESPLTPLEVTKLPMLDNMGYGKPGTSPTTGDPGQPLPPPQQPSGQHHHHHHHHHHKKSSDKEPSSTQTITASGRSSAPPLPSALYKSGGSSAAHGYPRSHSACPSPVSMGRALTPLSLKRPPPYDAVLTGTIPRSASGVPHGSRESGRLSNSSSIHGGSMQNVSTASGGSGGSSSGSGGRGCRTPTSPLDELSNLFTSGKNMLRKGSGGRKSKELCESEFQCFIDPLTISMEDTRLTGALPVLCVYGVCVCVVCCVCGWCVCTGCVCKCRLNCVFMHNSAPLPTGEPPSHVGTGVRIPVWVTVLCYTDKSPWTASRGLGLLAKARIDMDTHMRTRILGATCVFIRVRVCVKVWVYVCVNSVHMYVCTVEGKARSHSTDSKDRALRSSSPKAQDWDTPSGQSATPTRLGRSSVSPTTMLGGGASEPKAACKLGRSASTSGVPSPVGTPQRHAPEPSANQSGSPCQVSLCVCACLYECGYVCLCECAFYNYCV